MFRELKSSRLNLGTIDFSLCIERKSLPEVTKYVFLKSLENGELIFFGPRFKCPRIGSWEKAREYTDTTVRAPYSCEAEAFRKTPVFWGASVAGLTG